jgi:membrane protein YdbS with pleckstrin-like domain
MSKARMLPGEHVEARLRPHVFSFGGRFLIAAGPALWGLGAYLLLGSTAWSPPDEGSWWQFWRFLYGNAPAAYVYVVAGLAVLGAALSVITVRWRIFIWYLAAGVGAVAVTAVVFAHEYRAMLPAALAATAPPALLVVELDRRSHRFLLTNLRVLFRGGVVVRRERQLRYESITDLDSHQGPLGRLFGYGTLIPVTQSGFGLGADSSQALVAAGAGGRAGGKRAGAAGGLAVAAGGGKEVSVGRARTFHQLTGVHPYAQVRRRLEALIQAATATPYLREQVDLQRQILAALQPAGPAPPASKAAAHGPPKRRRRT